MTTPTAASKKQDIGERDYKVGDIVLAKIRGYPQWPGQLVDPEAVPDAVARERPPSKKTKFYAVRFFPAGDYSWTISKDLSLLQKHEIEAYINEPHKKSAELLKAYKIAMDPSSWEASLTAPDISTAEGDEEVEEEIDELDEAVDDGDSEKGASKAGKKRKRDSETKPRKKKEAGAKSTPGDIKDKKALAKKKTGKKNGVRKESVESEDDGSGEADAAMDERTEHVKADSSKKSAPPSKRTKKERPEEDSASHDPEILKVREWRHKLQRGFLSKVIPKAEEMPEYDKLFTTIENYDLTIDQLTSSKLGKVMRHITQIDPTKLQEEDKYQIRKRADALLERWQKFVHNSKEGPQGEDGPIPGVHAPVEIVNGSAASRLDVKNIKPKSESEKVPSAIADPAGTKPVSNAKANIDISANGTEKTGLAVEHTPNVVAQPAATDVAAGDDEQAMDMTDD